MALIAPGRRRAAAYLERVTFAIVKTAAARRQAHHAKPPGARSPAGLAAGKVSLVVIDGGKGAASECATPVGYKTARRALPQLLAGLAEADPRRVVAAHLADAVERVGAVKGVDWQGSDSKGAVSDGGATTRVKHAARLRMIEALANRWPIDRRHGPTRGRPRSLLTPKRATTQRHNILAFEALIAVCVEGQSLDAILRRHGWSPQTFNRDPLREAILEALDDVADGLGLGRAVLKKGVDGC